MRVVVVGAGIIGVCTAHALRRDGFDVTVLERRSGVAQEASFANAGVMAPGYVGPCWTTSGHRYSLCSRRNARQHDETRSRCR